MRTRPCVRFHRCAAVCIDVRKAEFLTLSPTASATMLARQEDIDMSSEPANPCPFALPANEAPRIAAAGTSADQLAEWGGVACRGVRFFLQPPVDLEISTQVDDYILVLPYSTLMVDLAIGDSPRSRRSLPAGSGMLVPPSTMVRARTIEAVEFLVVALSAERAEHVIDRAANGVPWAPAPVLDFIDAGIAGLAREARRSLIGDPLAEPVYLEALADALMARFACKLLGMGLRPPPKEALNPHALRTVTERVEERLASTLRVEELAEVAGLSRSHFSRAFQASTGLPPQEYIIHRRLSRAREMLVETEESVAQIAAQTGFSSQAHLSTAFKKRLGLSPGRYREAFRGETP